MSPNTACIWEFRILKNAKKEKKCFELDFLPVL
jgi:hypothetical protein